MDSFFVLIGKLLLIICIESVTEVFISDRRSKNMHKLIEVACYCGGLYVVMDYAFSNIFRELLGMLRLYF